jgi:uncharacterized membrane protein
MKIKNVIAAVSMMLTFAFTPTFAQTGMHSTGRTGDIRLESKVKVGDTILQPGRYRVQHVQQGEEHFMVFRELELPAGYRMFAEWPGKEVARVKCSVEPVETAVRKTNAVLRTGNSSSQTLREIYVRGEHVKHVFAG